MSREMQQEPRGYLQEIHHIAKADYLTDSAFDKLDEKLRTRLDVFNWTPLDRLQSD